MCMRWLGTSYTHERRPPTRRTPPPRSGRGGLATAIIALAASEERAASSLQRGACRHGQARRGSGRATMKSTGTRAAVAITVAVAVIAAIVAIAVSGGGGHTTTNASAQSQASGAKARGDVALAAAYLGVTRAQLHRELRSGRTLAQIANSTKGRSAAGLIQALVSAKSASLIAEAATTHLTAAKRSARLARLRAHVDAEVNRTRTGRTSLHVSGDLTAASSYLGIGRAELRSDLLARRTLAPVPAATPGKSTAGLIEAVVADRRAKLAAQVAAGHLSQTQA